MDVEQLDTAPVSISFKLEDPENFEQKKSSEILNLKLPASRANAKAAGYLHGPENLESVAGEHSKPQQCTVTAEGVEVFTGKAFLREATHTDQPESYIYDCFGNNADWLIDLKDKTLWDFVNPDTHLFIPSVIEDSWNYDRNNTETKDYVYAPVRRIKPFSEDGGQKNQVVTPFDLQPSISPYWILVRAFRSLGYKIESEFFSTTLFRNLCMPWTWGNFLFSEEAKFAPFRFRAMCTRQEISKLQSGPRSEWVSPVASPIGSLTQIINWDDVASGGSSGGFQGTPGLYSFNANKLMQYTYPASSTLGTVAMNFHLSTYYYTYSGGDQSWDLRVYWFITPAGQNIATNPNPADAVAWDVIANKQGDGEEESIVSVNRELVINPGDTVSAVMRVSAGDDNYSHNWKVGWPYPSSGSGSGSGTWPASFIENTYIKKAINSPVNLKDYSGFRKHKFLDFLRGLIDTFNLQINTDPVAKVVYIEPTDGYELPNGISPNREGYFKSEKTDWSHKQDLSKVSKVRLYSDNSREFIFRFRDDNNDGALAIIAKRENLQPGVCKYVFPERFAEGKEERSNRFFSPVMHIQMPGWANLLGSGKTPQLVALIPENVASTSASEDEQNFEPKLCYYKGYTNVNGGWKWKPDDASGVIVNTSMPFMFAVNYQLGGEHDPVLTYGDQRVGGIVVKGLVRRFFLTRLARMRNGKIYTTWMRLDLGDVTNPLHRDEKVIGQSSYHLIEIKDYRPLLPETVECTLWQKALPSNLDTAALAPSWWSVMFNFRNSPTDLKYVPMFILESDIPKKD